MPAFNIDPLIPESFVDELTALIDANSGFEDKVEAFQKSADPIQNITSAVSIILKYFKTAHEVLANIFTQDEIQWVHESIPAVKDITRCVIKSSEYLPVFMSALETLREEQETMKSSNKHDKSYSPGTYCPPPTTLTGPSLSRHIRRQTLCNISAEQLLVVADQIEFAISQWRDLHELCTALHERLSLSTEWAEFHNFIIPDIEYEIDSCFLSLFEIQEQHRPHKGPVDLALLSQSLYETPLFTCEKLPFQADAEKQLIFK